MKRLSSLLLILLCALPLFAQESKQEAMENIRTGGNYRWGEARSKRYEEARESARDDLSSKLFTTLVVDAQENNEERNYQVTSSSVGTVQNTQEIIFQEGDEWVCMVYISEDQLRAAIQDRKDAVVELIKIAQRQEQELRISDALKYYTWALRMLNTYKDKVKIDINGRRQDAKAWLTAHIPAMLDNIHISLSDNLIQDDPTVYDRYMVNLKADYAGMPVSTLQVSYYNGEHEISPVTFKSGEGTLAFPSLAGFQKIDLRVLYDYAADGRLYNSYIETTYPKRFKRLPFDAQAGKSISFNIDRDVITQRGTPTAPDYSATMGIPVQPAPQTGAPVTDSAGTSAVDPIVKPPRATIERNFEENPVEYINKMKEVETAIRGKNPESVKQLFTGEGFKIFTMIMKSGNVSVTKKKPDFTVERSNNFLIGKGIPVAIKVGKHISRENIVFRFDPQTGLISSLAYALTKRAEDDIFRQAQWSNDSRYTLLQFMEDYQTAFGIGRLDYIESIFSDDAHIIVGSTNASRGGSKGCFLSRDELADLNFKEPANVRYHTYNKSEYLQNVARDFKTKSYIQLVFEDTYISKVGDTGGYTDNEVLWIELKQQYSSSNYSDKGFLALQINLNPSQSVIKVRTWTPYFVPIDYLKKHFPIGREVSEADQAQND